MQLEEACFKDRWLLYWSSELTKHEIHSWKRVRISSIHFPLCYSPTGCEILVVTVSLLILIKMFYHEEGWKYLSTWLQSRGSHFKAFPLYIKHTGVFAQLHRLLRGKVHQMLVQNWLWPDQISQHVCTPPIGPLLSDFERLKIESEPISHGR